MHYKKTNKLLSFIITVIVLSSAVYLAALLVRNANIKEAKAYLDAHKKESIIIDIDSSYEETELATGKFLMRDIYINGYHINNWNLKYPFLTISEQVYVPMSKNILDALGLNLYFNDEYHHVIFENIKEPSKSFVSDAKNACNLKNFDVYYGHEYCFNSTIVPKHTAFTTKENRMLYLSLEGLKEYSGLFLTYYEDEFSGIYISTIDDINAKDFYSENNREYIEGRVNFMMNINRNLSLDDAKYYEYLFRHEAKVCGNVDEDLLITIAKVESSFIKDAKSYADAYGLMQVLGSVAINDGYSKEKLFEPEYNIEKGASFISWFCESAKGDLALGLSLYFHGPGNVEKQIKEHGDYDHYYANVCINNKSMLEYYTLSNAYSNEFLEYTIQ